MSTMPILLALALALNLNDAGKPAKAVDVGHGKAVVIMVGRPVCYAHANGKDPKNAVVVCQKPGKKLYHN